MGRSFHSIPGPEIWMMMDRKIVEVESETALVGFDDADANERWDEGRSGCARRIAATKETHLILMRNSASFEISRFHDLQCSCYPER
jgi:hypothetical protein